jgi:hypothetical protein
MSTVLWTLITWTFIGGVMYGAYHLGQSMSSESIGTPWRRWWNGAAGIALMVAMFLFGGGYSQEGYDQPITVTADTWAEMLGALVALVAAYSLGYFDGRAKVRK